VHRILQQDFLAGLFFLVLGLVTLFVLIPIGIDEPANVQYRALAPSYWPQIVAVMLAVIGFSILARTIGQSAPPAASEGVAHGGYLYWRAAVVILGSFALYGVLEWLGFVLTCAIALAALMLLAGERRPHVIAVIAAGVPMLLYLFFTKAASIPIPSGILEPVLSRV